MIEDNDDLTVDEFDTVSEIETPIHPADVDASWDGKGSLDEHRQKAFKTIEQPGFGTAGKAKVSTDGE
jgi:hypothetical protein